MKPCPECREPRFCFGPLESCVWIPLAPLVVRFRLRSLENKKLTFENALDALSLVSLSGNNKRRPDYDKQMHLEFHLKSDIEHDKS